MIRLNFRLCSRITLFLPDVGICEESVISILYVRSVLHFYYIYPVIRITHGLSRLSLWDVSLPFIYEW